MKINMSIIVLMMVLILITQTYQQSFPPLFQGLLKALREGLQYSSNEPTDRPIILKEYDFIIVGAGSAGNVIANRLTEIPEWKVLLIEAGCEESIVMDTPILANMIQFTQANWNYKTVPSNEYCLGMNNHQCNFPRGKVMGGSSVLNYMIYTRGHWKDFDNWANMGNTGWDYQNVLKYFKKLEDVQIPRYASDTTYRSTGGYQTITEAPYHSKSAETFVKAGVEMGFPTPDINGQFQIGFSYHQLTMRNGTRCSTSRAYLHPIRDRPNLHVKKYSTVTKILINPKTKVAYGVEFQRKKRKFRVLARKEIILSAGAINSPQLLMLSGIGPREHLEEKGIPVIEDLPVGENLMDHVALGGMSFTMNDKVSIMTHRLLEDPYSINDFLHYHRGPISIPGGTEALAFFDLEDLNNIGGHPDLELLFINGMLSSEATLRKNFGITDEIYDRVYKPNEGVDGITIFPMVLRPKSKGRILLNDVNPFRHPLIYPNYFSDERDLDVLVKGVRLSQKLIIETEAMRGLKTTLLNVSLPGCLNYTFDSDDYWKCHARNLPFTIYHLSGTCKMAPVTDSTCVVDPRLRVKGVKNLRVADASIMPEITASHINSPTIMIGEKASDLIKQDWNVEIELF
ncbi:glucose dehydrogenase [FAD, quinone]-like [Planococcus citri]|uniref:glucose dehydrogenase [FAD, quinone]-like n=1 Tax=Planococcus citri TaxID=170843 RepID=UPI0031F8FA86